jgi:hypothetical protein
LPGLEAQIDWDSHMAAMLKNLSPVGYLEEMLAERAALLLWRLARVARYERETCATAIEEAHDPEDPLRLRYLQEMETPECIRENTECSESVLSFLQEFGHLAAASTVEPDVAVALAADVWDGPGGDFERDTDHIWDRENWTVGDLREVVDRVAKLAGISDDAVLAQALEKAKVGLVLRSHDLRVAEWRKRKVNRRVRQNLLPLAHEADKLARYEGHLERCLYKALHELQRLQAVRKGEYVPAPAALDVTLDGGFVSQNGTVDRPAQEAGADG